MKNNKNVIRSTEDRNTLIEANLGLAKSLAGKRYISIHHTVQFTELLSAANLGLLDAAEKFEESKVNVKAKEPFRCYAKSRIWGAMNDYLRTCNWGTRNNPKHLHSLEGTSSFYDSGGDDDRETSVSLRDTLQSSELSAVDRLNSLELFNKIIRCLPKREKQVFQLRFLEELTMKEVGDVLGISESRVCQILSQNTEYLKEVWSDKEADLWSETVCH